MGKHGFLEIWLEIFITYLRARILGGVREWMLLNISIKLLLCVLCFLCSATTIQHETSFYYLFFLKFSA